MPKPRTALLGSERKPIAKAEYLKPADPQERLTVTVVVRRKQNLEHSATLISHGELVQTHGATANDLSSVRDFATGNGLEVVAESVAKRTVTLSGTVAQMEAAFGVKLEHVQVEGNVVRQRVGPIYIPNELVGIVSAVLGLDDRPQARPHSRFRNGGEFVPRETITPFTPLQIAQLYGFPSGDGAGQTIAILELGGGFRTADLSTYFGGLGLPTPAVTAASVLGATNSPGSEADGEVMLDIEVAGAVAPKTQQIVYFAPNTAQGFLAALQAATHDGSTAPTAISISWGGPESQWTPQAMTAFEQALQDAAALGIAVCVAAGDQGSSDGTSGTTVDFPASAPHALACGGTLLRGSGTAITSEVVWNDSGATGGGVSEVFSKPSYQSKTNVPKSPGGKIGRGAPDVSGNAAAGSPYKIRVDGADQEAWGTSAVAPLWSGLVVLLTQNLGKRLPFLNPLLYDPKVSSAFRDITSGKNGAYSAHKGWDACTGLGSPKGAALVNALKKALGGTGSTGTGSTGTGSTGTGSTGTGSTGTGSTGTGSTGTGSTGTGSTGTGSTGTGSTGTGSTGTGSTGDTFTSAPLPAIHYAPFEAAPAPLAPQPSVGSGSGRSVALVGVVGTVALMGMVAATGLIAAVALGKGND